MCPLGDLRVLHSGRNLSRAQPGRSISATRQRAANARNGWRPAPEDLASNSDAPAGPGPWGQW